MRGAAGTRSRICQDWCVRTPILCISGKKASPTCLWGTASCRPPQGRLGSTEDAFPMPTRSQRILPGLPVMSEQTYAAFPVWSESTAKPVRFTPLSKKEALSLWHRARDFDRQTHKPGKHGGAIGPSGLQVLHVF